MKIWIDAGHGGSASGAVYAGRMEKNDTLRMAKELQRQFETQGFETVMTRTSDVYVSTAERTKRERENNCDLAISCHRNSSGVKSASGFEVWVHTHAPQSIIDWCGDIVKGMEECGMKIRNGKNGNYVRDGVYRGYIGSVNENYYANSGTNSPSCMLEVGFMANDEDNTLFDNSLKELCAAVVKASCRFLGVTYRESEKTAEAPAAASATLYRVQVGAFSKLENAERLQDTLYGLGFDSIIVEGTSTLSMLADDGKKSATEIAAEVWAGKWGNGAERKERLTAAGYDYNAIQAKIKELYY